MKIDWSELNDAQINIMVCKARGLELSSYARIIKFDDHTILLSDNVTLVDFCNSWSDAGPIIEEHNISLHCYVVNRHCKKWRAIMGANQSNSVKPLRAAMIVYLETCN